MLTSLQQVVAPQPLNLTENCPVFDQRMKGRAAGTGWDLTTHGRGEKKVQCGRCLGCGYLLCLTFCGSPWLWHLPCMLINQHQLIIIMYIGNLSSKSLRKNCLLHRTPQWTAGIKWDWGIPTYDYISIYIYNYINSLSLESDANQNQDDLPWCCIEACQTGLSEIWPVSSFMCVCVCVCVCVCACLWVRITSGMKNTPDQLIRTCDWNTSNQLQNESVGCHVALWKGQFDRLAKALRCLICFATSQ